MHIVSLGFSFDLLLRYIIEWIHTGPTLVLKAHCFFRFQFWFVTEIYYWVNSLMLNAQSRIQFLLFLNCYCTNWICITAKLHDLSACQFNIFCYKTIHPLSLIVDWFACFLPSIFFFLNNGIMHYLFQRKGWGWNRDFCGSTCQSLSTNKQLF